MPWIRPRKGVKRVGLARPRRRTKKESYRNINYEENAANALLLLNECAVSNKPLQHRTLMSPRSTAAASHLLELSVLRLKEEHKEVQSGEAVVGLPHTPEKSGSCVTPSKIPAPNTIPLQQGTPRELGPKICSPSTILQQGTPRGLSSPNTIPIQQSTPQRLRAKVSSPSTPPLQQGTPRESRKEPGRVRQVSCVRREEGNALSKTEQSAAPVVVHSCDHLPVVVVHDSHKSPSMSADLHVYQRKNRSPMYVLQEPRRRLLIESKLQRSRRVAKRKKKLWHAVHCDSIETLSSGINSPRQRQRGTPRKPSLRFIVSPLCSKRNSDQLPRRPPNTMSQESGIAMPMSYVNVQDPCTSQVKPCDEPGHGKERRSPLMQSQTRMRTCESFVADAPFLNDQRKSISKKTSVLQDQSAARKETLKSVSRTGNVRRQLLQQFSNEVHGRVEDEITCVKEPESLTPWTYNILKRRTTKEFKHLTGITQQQFEVLFKFLGGHEVCSKLKYNYIPHTPKRFRKKTLLPKDCLLLTLVRLRRGYSVVDTGLFFNISTASASRIFYVWIQFVYLQFKRMQERMFTSRFDQAKSGMPHCFKAFKNYRCTLDTTNVDLQTPYNYQQQGNTYSDYYSGNVIKYLFATNIWGSISYVSPGCEGSMQDTEVFMESGISQFLIPGDVLLVDRGFFIEDYADEHQIKIVRPPFKGERPSLSTEEITLTKMIAAARIHVERAVRKVKCFWILNHITNKMLPILDQIVYIIACLVNFDGPNL